VVTDVLMVIIAVIMIMVDRVRVEILVHRIMSIVGICWSSDCSALPWASSEIPSVQSLHYSENLNFENFERVALSGGPIRNNF